MSEHGDQLEMEEAATYTSPIEVEAEVIEPSGSLQVAYTPAVFEDNLAALDAYVDKQLAPYVGAKIDPDDTRQVKEARACLADLNKLKKPIEDERKRIKRTYEEPLKAFEGRVKAITSKIDDARAALKEQVDAADAAFKQRRLALLEEEYEGCAGAMAGVVPFGAVLDEKWLNRSTAESKAVNSLYEKAQEALKGYNALQSKELRHKDEVVKHYAETLDLIGALEREDQLNERDRQMEEFKAAQREARAVAQQRIELDPEPGPEPVEDRPAEAAPRVCIWSLDMEFQGTEAFAREVAATLKGMGITGAAITFQGVVSNG